MRKEIENEIVSLRRAYDHVSALNKAEVALGKRLEISYPKDFAHFLEIVEKLIEENKTENNWVSPNIKHNENCVPVDWYAAESLKVGTLKILTYLSKSEQKRLGLDDIYY